MKNKSILLTIGMIFLVVSCNEENFLDKQPPGSASGDVMATEKGVESLLIGAYRSLYGTNWYGDCGSDWGWGDAYSDNAGYGASSSGNQLDYYGMLTSSSTYPEFVWGGSYAGVSKANDVLDYLRIARAKNEILDERGDVIEAEAKFIRAWHHFRLQRLFWQVPYIKTIEEMGGMEPENVPNDRLVWDDIEEDLQYCIDFLPPEHPKGEPGRPTMYAAMAFKARVHLHQYELADAKRLLDNIIGSGKYELVESFQDNFRETTENNIESIFELQCNVGDVTQRANTMPIMEGCFHQRGAATRGWGAFQPSQNLFEAYQVDGNGLPILSMEDRVTLAHDMNISSNQEFIPTDHLLDPRVDFTIARRGIPFLDWGIHHGASWIRSQSHGGPYMTIKFHHYLENEGWATAGGGSKNSRNFRAYRYAVILLWRAEIAVEDGDLELARSLVNKIRERAGNEVVMGRCTTYIFDGREIQVDWDQPAANYKVGAYPSDADAFSTKEKAREAVRLELRLETATEGHRFYDLKRWDVAVEVLNKYIEHDIKIRYYLQGRTFTDKMKNLPIPQTQIDLQPGILQQDPNY